MNEQLIELSVFYSNERSINPFNSTKQLIQISFLLKYLVFLSCLVFKIASLNYSWHTTNCMYLKFTMWLVLTHLYTIKPSPQSREWMNPTPPEVYSCSFDNHSILPHLSFPLPPQAPPSVFYRSIPVFIICSFIYMASLPCTILIDLFPSA